MRWGGGEGSGGEGVTFALHLVLARSALAHLRHVAVARVELTQHTHPVGDSAERGLPWLSPPPV
jgi:hypothetical protein